MDPTSWIDQYGDTLFRFAILRVRDQNTAEDLVQETLLSALKAADQFAGKSSEKTWLISILKNKIIDHYRKSATNINLNTIKVDSLDDEIFTYKGEWNRSFAPTEWGATPEQKIEQKEFIQILQNCFAGLPERLGQILSMRTMDDIDSETICKEFDITVSNLWVLLHRARTLLRQCLDQNWFQTMDYK